MKLQLDQPLIEDRVTYKEFIPIRHAFFRKHRAFTREERKIAVGKYKEEYDYITYAVEAYEKGEFLPAFEVLQDNGFTIVKEVADEMAEKELQQDAAYHEKRAKEKAVNAFLMAEKLHDVESIANALKDPKSRGKFEAVVSRGLNEESLNSLFDEAKEKNKELTREKFDEMIILHYAKESLLMTPLEKGEFFKSVGIIDSNFTSRYYNNAKDDRGGSSLKEYKNIRRRNSKPLRRKRISKGKLH